MSDIRLEPNFNHYHVLIDDSVHACFYPQDCEAFQHYNKSLGRWGILGHRATLRLFGRTTRVRIKAAFWCLLGEGIVVPRLGHCDPWTVEWQAVNPISEWTESLDYCRSRRNHD